MTMLVYNQESNPAEKRTKPISIWQSYGHLWSGSLWSGYKHSPYTVNGSAILCVGNVMELVPYLPMDHDMNPLHELTQFLSLLISHWVMLEANQVPM